MKRAAVMALCCAALGGALFARTLGAGFVWDDRAAIVFNADVRPETPLGDVFSHDFWGQPLTHNNSHKSYRPLSTLSLRLDYTLWGLNPAGYHLQNVLLHAAVTGLVTLLAASLGFGAAETLAAGVAFAVHPVHVEAVASLVSRADLLCGACYAGAVLAYLAGRHAGSGVRSSLATAASLALCLCALFCKEVGITSFVAVAGLEVLVLGGALRRSSSSTSTAATVSWGRAAAIGAACAAAFAWRLSLHWGVPNYRWSIYENQLPGMEAGLSRVLTTAYTHAWYAWLFMFPRDLAYTHGYADIYPITSLTDGRLGWVVATYVALAAAVAILAWRRRDGPGTWALLAAGCPALLPALNIVMWVGTEVAERLWYVPSIGFTLALVRLVPVQAAWEAVAAAWAGGQSATAGQPLQGGKKAKKSGAAAAAPASSAGVAAAAAPTEPLPRPAALATLALVATAALTGAVWSVVRAGDWLDEVALFRRGAEVGPRNFKALSNYASHLMGSSDPDELAQAKALLLRSLDILPEFPMGWSNLGTLAAAAGDAPAAFSHFWSAVNASFYSELALPCKVSYELARTYGEMATLRGAYEVEPWALESGGAFQASWLANLKGMGLPTTTPALALIYFDAALKSGCAGHETYHSRGNVLKVHAGPAAALPAYAQAVAALGLRFVEVEEAGGAVAVHVAALRSSGEASGGGGGGGGVGVGGAAGAGPVAVPPPSLMTQADVAVGAGLDRLAAGFRGRGGGKSEGGDDPRAAVHAAELATTANMISMCHRGLADEAYQATLRSFAVPSPVQNDGSAAAAVNADGSVSPAPPPGADTVWVVPEERAPAALAAAEAARAAAWELASAYAEAAIRLRPDDPVFRTNAVSLWVDMGRLDAALQHGAASVALPEGRRNAVVVTNYGYALERAGRLQEALAVYAQAAALAPDHPQVAANYAALAGRLGAR